MAQSILATLLLLFLLPAYADTFEETANKLFKDRFNENTIKGQGHIFWIVLDCDNSSLTKISEKLSENEIKIIEYDFMFNIHTKNKDKSNITGTSLSKSIKQCIIKKYHKDIFFTSMAPDVMETKISFPAVLSKGKEPVAPKTPIFWITQEN